MFEAQLFVVVADARIVPETIESEEVAPGLDRLGVRPRDDRGADSPSGTVPPDCELVHVDGVGRSLAPVQRVIPQKRDRRDGIPFVLDHVHLGARDRRRELVARKGERPLLVAQFADPAGCLIQELGHRVLVLPVCGPDVHSTSIASPNE